MKLHLVFDLDQTLVRGASTDWTCYLDACEEALGVPIARDDDWAAWERSGKCGPSALSDC